MNDIDIGLFILKDTIANNKRHQDYKRVCDLADKYKKLFTGEEIDSLMKQIMRREDAGMFQQRKDLFQSVMPAVANNLSKVFIKPLRSNRVFASIETKDGKAFDEINDRKRTFWQGESESGVDAYLKARWFDLVRLDPNAFIVEDFAAFDSKIEKAQPYPVEYSSKEAINYQYRNGKLDWLITETKIQYQVKDGEGFKGKDGCKYIMFLENDAIIYTEIDLKEKLTNIENPQIDTVGLKGKERAFVVQMANPKSGEVPAIRVGYDSDPMTGGRTCLSIFHYAVPFFMKELKAGSELDITMAMHAFPQKIQYGRRCEGDKANGQICKDGKDANGQECAICHGTKIAPVHTSGMDVMLVPFPKPNDPMLDLNNMMVYKGPDIALVQFQNVYVDTLTEKARKAIFGGTTMIQKAGLKTATEADYAMDDVYDALHPFAAKYSAVWLFLMNLIAVYTDNATGLKLYHSFPMDFKMKSLEQLLLELKAANDSGAPQHIVEAISNDMQEILYADDQDTLSKIKIKNKFYPFSGKSKDEIQTVLIQGKTTRYFEVLYTHFDIIFDQIDSELADSFYLMEITKQKVEVKKRVDGIIREIDKEKMAKIPIGIEGDMIGGNTLKDSVGGLTGMIEIAKAVASGLYDLEAAVALVADRFGITEDAARRQLGSPSISNSPQQIEKVAQLV